MRILDTLKNIKPAWPTRLPKPRKPSPPTVSRIVVWTLVAIMVAAGLLYIQAGRIPDNYRPLRLSEKETRIATENFARHIAQGFGNKVKMVKPFEWSITQQSANSYLASIDEIAFSLPNGVKRGHINNEMDKLGLADPALAFDDGKVTLMIRSTKFNKILSAEIAVTLVEGGKLKFSLNATRIGKLRVPSSFLTDMLTTLAEKLSGKRGDDISETLAELLNAIGGEPISPPDAWRIQGVRVALDAVTVDDGALKLKVRPIPPKRK